MIKTPPAAEIGLPSHHPFFDIIEAGYREFSSPKPAETGVCECCMDADKWSELLAPDIRALPIGSLREWFAASCERHSVPYPTWRYLLPRILDALAAEAWLDAAGLEVSLSWFETGNPDRWTLKQWAVLDRFQRLYLERCINGGAHRLDDVICMFRLSGWSLECLLAQVAASSAHCLIMRYWKDWCENTVAGRESICLTNFWQGHDRKTVFDFYCSNSMLDRATDLALADTVPERISRMASSVVHAIEQARIANSYV